MKDGDVFVLLDQILEAARLATSYVEGMTEDAFLADNRTQQAVAMNSLSSAKPRPGSRDPIRPSPRRMANFHGGA
ncbi:hypothetical protein V3H18_11480 [Methylocystis sp. 9N]|uniref:Uncharacterized protein n=1 Tax=Methylocystis borbori TaxID=3118750 RepID=A0ABU7XIE3_9HYPH